VQSPYDINAAPLAADPRPDTRPLERTALGSLNIELLHAEADAVTARMPVTIAAKAGALLVLAETVASTAAGIAAGANRRALGTELNGSTNAEFNGVMGRYVVARATPARITDEQHVWQIVVTDEAGREHFTGRCTLIIVDAR
jgi:uncharacterized protein (TIGR00369 family)